MRLERLAYRPFSYPEVGATRGPRPDGYRLVDLDRPIGTGRA